MNYKKIITSYKFFTWSGGEEDLGMKCEKRGKNNSLRFYRCKIFFMKASLLSLATSFP
jgi:hypothetical protein